MGFLHPLDTNNLCNIELEFHDELLLALKQLNYKCVPKYNEQSDYYGKNLNFKLPCLILKLFN